MHNGPKDHNKNNTRQHAGKPLLIAAGLSLGVAIALGMGRFAFGLLLPPMREDLGWSYALAGGLNTSNALGYLAGALAAPWLLRRTGAQTTLLLGALLTSLFMALCAGPTDAASLLALRFLTGGGSAFIFVAGGLLAARLGAIHPSRSGLVLGIYYSGAGLGIVLSSLTVPWSQHLSENAHLAHTWQAAWLWLGALCAVASGPMHLAARTLDGTPAPVPEGTQARTSVLRIAMLAYFMFGLGYIGYMTFVIALLREQQFSPQNIILFYILLGLACMASSRLWAPVLDRFRGGQALALLCGLLGTATLLAASSTHPLAIFASGILFGAVFLSTVASTTALVKHNLPPAQWARGISAFTVIFAVGQVVGPTLTGLISDSPAGLQGGLVFSGMVLLLGSVISMGQKAVDPQSGLDPR